MSAGVAAHSGLAAGPDLEHLARVFGVLANPMRLRIVGLVAAREMSGSELAEALGISRALACHHLTKLADCGLVRRRRAGKAQFCMLDRGLLGRHLVMLQRLARAGTANGS